MSSTSPDRAVIPAPASPSASSNSSLSYDDSPGLLTDLQTLLCDLPDLSDTQILLPSPEPSHIPVHTQLLSARAKHLAVALHPPWRRPDLPLHDDPEAVRDALEFLYTGAVRLELETGSAVRVAALAHYAGISDLEDITLEHLAAALRPGTFLAHLRCALGLPGGAVPACVAALLRDCVAAFPARILTEAALTEAEGEEVIPLVRCIWLLLAERMDVTATDERSLKNAPDPTSVLEGLKAWSTRHRNHSLDCGFRDTSVGAATTKPGDDGCSQVGLKDDSQPTPISAQKLITSAQPLANVLHSASDAAERAALVSVLTSPSVQVFSRLVEPLGLLSPEEVLAKYREAAVAPRVFESAHPHRFDGGFVTRMRVELEECAIGARVRFDYRTSLRDGALLSFFVDENGGGVIFCLQGSVANDMELVETGIIVPHRMFWFSFLSGFRARDKDVEIEIGTRWGFRFVVEPYFSLPQGCGLDSVDEVLYTPSTSDSDSTRS